MVSQLWSHGRWTASPLAQEALAVSGGVADYVAVTNAHVSERGYGRHFASINNRLDESFRDGGGPYGGWSVHGSPGAGTGAAMVAQQYLDRYGAPAADLDVGFVRIAGIEGIHAGRDNYVFFSRPGLGSGMSPAYDYVAPSTSPVYDTAGISRSEIDALYLYDPFAHMVWMTLERWGFCPAGEAAALVRRQGMDLDSPLPINTHGGLLAEGHLFGYGHIIEMTRQLRVRPETGRSQVRPRSSGPTAGATR